MTPGSPPPWDGAVPASDVESFPGWQEALARPLSGGVRPALIVVDMQRAFVDPSYPTGSVTGASAVAAVGRLLAAARAAVLPIYFTTADTGARRVTDAERGRWKCLGDPQVVRASDVAAEEIVDALRPLDGEIVIDKGSRPSAFFGSPLASYLIHQGRDTVIVTGMTTSGCVRATVVDAFQYNFQCLVPFQCVADRSQISHKVNLFDLHMKYADVVSLDQTIDYVRSVASPART